MVTFTAVGMPETGSITASLDGSSLRGESGAVACGDFPRAAGLAAGEVLSQNRLLEEAGERGNHP